MPAWITHIVTANKILNKIKIEDRNDFLFGNILPDINNAHFVKNVKNVLSHSETHFTRQEDLKEVKFNYYNIERFKGEYKKNIKNPLVLGYLVHILTDSYWNEIAYNEHYIYNKNKEFIGLKLHDKKIINCDKNAAVKAKQKDFNVFSDYLLSKNKDIELPYYTEKLIKEVDMIKENPITDIDIRNTVECLKNMVKSSTIDEEYKYQLFTCEELEKKFDKSIEIISSEIKVLLI